MLPNEIIYEIMELSILNSEIKELENLKKTFPELINELIIKNYDELISRAFKEAIHNDSLNKIEYIKKINECEFEKLGEKYALEYIDSLLNNKGLYKYIENANLCFENEDFYEFPEINEFIKNNFSTMMCECFKRLKHDPIRIKFYLLEHLFYGQDAF